MQVNGMMGQAGPLPQGADGAGQQGQGEDGQQGADAHDLPGVGVVQALLLGIHRHIAAHRRAGHQEEGHGHRVVGFRQGQQEQQGYRGDQDEADEADPVQAATPMINQITARGKTNLIHLVKGTRAKPRQVRTKALRGVSTLVTTSPY